MHFAEGALLAAGGLAAGFANTLAGGGSLLTVPLLGLVGLPGSVANGTNRVGVFFGSATATWRLAAEGAAGLREAAPLIAPTALGALLGARLVVELPAEWFNRVFGVLMLALLPPTLRVSAPRAAAASPRPERRAVPAPLRFAAFFAIGVYGGAFQAGVGVLLLAVLSLAGLDLVRSTQIKTALNTCFTLLALPVFLWAGQIVWPEALARGAGFTAGGALGARAAVRGGARVIRPLLAIAVIALAGRMLGLY
jgi:uncharacterized membrane protein YfcA